MTIDLKIKEIPILLIASPHAYRNEERLDKIIASMNQGGWQGRPLLVIDTKSPDVGADHPVRLFADGGWDGWILNPPEVVQGRYEAAELMSPGHLIDAIEDYQADRDSNEEEVLDAAEFAHPQTVSLCLMPRYFALTGSHRYAAASATGQRCIPCVCVDMARLTAVDVADIRTQLFRDDDARQMLFSALGDRAAEWLMTAECEDDWY